MRRLTRLREWRERRLLTMRELADLAGVGYVTVWRLENGKSEAELRTIRKLAQALNVTAEDLMGEQDQGHDKAAA